ncbi:MAG: winged helix-turn-helix transcriptional regulator [Solirubrobacteraceae bacterium]
MEILRSLAGGPLQPAQIEQRVAIARSTMHARLRELTITGVVLQRERERLPRLVEYALTDDGRIASARAIITHRIQRRQLAPTGYGPDEDLRHVLTLLAPVTRLRDGVEGTCALLKHRARHEVRLLAQAGRLRPCKNGHRQTPPIAMIAATSAAWDGALLTGRTDDLSISGDHGFAEAVLAAICATMR